MNVLIRVASFVALFATVSIASADFTGDVTGGGIFSDSVSTVDGWQFNNPAANGVDFWTLTISEPSYLSVNVISDIDFGISVYQGAVSDSLGFAFDNAADFEDPLTFAFGTFIAGTPNFGVAGSSLVDSLLSAAGIYTIAVGGADFGFAGPYQYDMSVSIAASTVPAPAAIWLYATGLIGLLAARSQRGTAV